jgi:hypothetical protein
MDVAAPRTGYAFVRVNGADYGVYVNVETYDDVSLPRWFASTQHLYEGEYGADVTRDRRAELQVHEGSKTDQGDLDALIAALDDAGPSDWFTRVSAKADLSQMVRMWAVEKYVGAWDGYAAEIAGPRFPNNYYIHDDASGRFTMLPWGADQTWNGRIAFDGGAGRLFLGCVAAPRCFGEFRNAVSTVRTTAMTLGLDERASRIAAALAPYQARDPRRPYSPEQIAATVKTTRAFVAARPAEAERWLKGSGGM